MVTMLLEEKPGGKYRGWSRKLLIEVTLRGDDVHVAGRTTEGEPVFEWTENVVEDAMERLAEQEGMEAVVVSTADGQAKVHKARLARPLPPVWVADGVISLPPFVWPSGGQLGRDEQAYVQLTAARVAGIFPLRVGQHVGSVVALVDAPSQGVAVGVEPGAVLMAIFNVSPEDAARLGSA